MLSFLSGRDAHNKSYQDRLYDERTRLSRCHESLERYTEALKLLRRTLYDSYQETKGWKFPWKRYDLMSGMITNVLEAYEKVRQSQLKDERVVTLTRLGLVDTMDSCITQGDTTATKAAEEDMTTKELESEVDRLRIETAKQQEVYRMECDVFRALQREFVSLQKYGIVQRYIIIKLLIKIAGTSDV